MSKRQQYKSVDLQCPKCKTIQSIYRRKANLKKVGHLKKLYCYKCNEYTNHIELVDKSYFEVANFDNLIPVNKKKDKVICVQKELF